MIKNRYGETQKLNFKKISDKIVHITLPNYEELAKALIRFQEYYESPYPEIRGKIFTLGYVRSKGNRKTGLNTYEGGNHFGADWAGYNFPSHVLEPFIKGLFDPLTSYEQDIVNALKLKEGKFYVIGTLEDADPRNALPHEIAHALYYTEPQYKKDVDKVLSKYDLKGLFQWLRDDGYCDEVLLDEEQAYLGPDYDWLMADLKNVEKYKIKIPKKCHEELTKIRKRYKI